MESIAQVSITGKLLLHSKTLCEF